MKLLLFNPAWRGLVSRKTSKLHLQFPPLDLILLHTLASRQGHESVIIDGFAEGAASRDTAVASADWIIITTTPHHMWQCPDSDWHWIKEGLKVFPKEKTVITGLHGSVFPEQVLRETGVHALVRQEPEAPLVHFLECRRWQQTPGVSYLENGEYRENPAPAPYALDELVLDDYPVDISRYSYFLLGRNTAIFESSRGCPWKCIFCEQEMFNWKYRTKTPEAFAEEVARCVRQQPIKTAYFFDLEFTLSKKRTIAICEELIRKGVPQKLRWTCQTRADAVDEDILQAMRDAGCKLIHYGVESASQATLNQIGKKANIERIREGILLTKRKRIQTACFFLFGLPGEDQCDFERTLEFAREVNPTYASFHFSIPLPNTPLYTRFVEETNPGREGWFPSYFTKWNDEERRAYISRAVKRFYLMPRRIEPAEIFFRLQYLPLKLRYFLSVT